MLASWRRCLFATPCSAVPKIRHSSVVTVNCLAANPRRLLDAPQRPTKKTQRYHLFTLLFAQDIAHADRG
jgi:hypothetical protein